MGPVTSKCIEDSKRKALSRCIDYDDCATDDILPLGQIYFSSSLTKEKSDSKSTFVSSILTSLGKSDEMKRERQVFQCIVKRKLMNQQQEQGKDLFATYVLCWVSKNGILHHYYKNKEKVDSGDDKTSASKNDSEVIFDHTEQTYTGDAFVLFQLKRGKTKLPKSVDELFEDSGKLYNIICSYRLHHAIDPCFYGHCLQVEEDDKNNGNQKFKVKIYAKPQEDNEYRTIIRAPQGNNYRLPPFTESWEFEYTFRCPPLPRRDLWDKHFQTLYIWGDLDFQHYDAPSLQQKKKNKNRISDIRKNLQPCTMNQIVPQVMTGRCLAANDKKTYEPSWIDFDSWVIQAQYFWQTKDSEPRALCGSIIRVEPGDILRTVIKYNATEEDITASIEVLQNEKESNNIQRSNNILSLRNLQKRSKTEASTSECSDTKSEIKITRPFLHDESLFDSWKDFFQKCQYIEEELLTKNDAKNQRNIGPLARPGLCVEYKGKVNVDIMKDISPFEILKIGGPGEFDSNLSKWRSELFCPRVGHVSTLRAIEGVSCLNLNAAVSFAGMSYVTPTSRLLT